MKLLIVEDDYFLLKMYKKKFENEGYEVFVAVDGKQGIEKAAEIMPDMILMDIMMPKLNGLDALDLLKKDEKTKNIPVVILTNLSTSDDADTALNKGAVKYIIKSDFTPSEVVKEVEEIVAKK